MAQSVFDSRARKFWGSRGRRFKSCRPDLQKNLVFKAFRYPARDGGAFGKQPFVVVVKKGTTRFAVAEASVARSAASVAAIAAGPCHVSSCWQSISSSSGISSLSGHAARASRVLLVFLVLVFFLSLAFSELL